MTLQAFRTLLHETREAVLNAPVRSSVYPAIVGELRLACMTADLAVAFTELRSGIFRAVIELALRNVLDRRELVAAHDAAQRALRCIVEAKAVEGHEIEPAPPSTKSIVDEAAVDVALALIHTRDARTIVEGLPATLGDQTLRVLVEKLTGVCTILERLDGAA